MKKRPLGRTGLTVADVGFGAWAIGGTMWGGADDAVSREALARALDLGVDLFDTALVYGEGRSERLVGEAVRGRRDQVVLCTKVPPKDRKWPATNPKLEQVYPVEHVVASCEQSLKNLGTDYIDVLQLHGWFSNWYTRADALWDCVNELKRAGKIRHFGVSLNDHDPDSILPALRGGSVREDHGMIEVVQVIYNIFDQSPDHYMLSRCEEMGVGVLARCPFDEGALTGKLRTDTVFPEGDFRRRYFKGKRLAETVERVERIRWLEREGRSFAQAALGFVLGNPTVACVIPGMRNAKQVEENVAATRAGRLDEGERGRLLQVRWDKNFYQDDPEPDDDL